MKSWSLEEKADGMGRFPLFSGLDRTLLLELARLCRIVSIRKKAVLFREGDPAIGFYLLVEGKMKLSKISAGGKEQIIHFVNAGSSFAEAALYTEQRYPVFAEALEDCTLIFVPRDRFAQMLGDNRELAVNLVGHLAQFLHQLAKKVEELSLMDATGRMCRFLAANMDSDTGIVRLSMGKGQTASSLGIAVETFSRTLARLKSDGVIKEASPGVMQVLDPETLKELAL
ncbi:MAG TPA: Crp/Fnr family transcriptional regulator [Proteobacteria bacterium]|nr:anaerobic regulatory protein [bacterium BMS3Abin14]HDL53723.1 Crp/Fnr family transcriptional regulator [Pseudomonadota bacterium]